MDLSKTLTVYGRKPVLEALRDPTLDPHRLHLADKNKPGGIISEIETAAKKRSIPMTSPRRPRKTGQNRVDIRIKAGIARKVRPNRGPRAKRAGFQSRARRLVQRANPTSAAALPQRLAVEAMHPNGIARRPMILQNGLYPPVAKPRQDPHAQWAARARESCACQRDQTPCRGGASKIERK